MIPKVLVLDEPTSGLDPNQITEIRNLIREIGEERTVLLSTHIMQEVEAMCSRVIILNQGKLVADDSIERLAATKHEQGKTLVVKFKNSCQAIRARIFERGIGRRVVARKQVSVNHYYADDIQEQLFCFRSGKQKCIARAKRRRAQFRTRI